VPRTPLPGFFTAFSQANSTHGKRRVTQSWKRFPTGTSPIFQAVLRIIDFLSTSWRIVASNRHHIAFEAKAAQKPER
jgi:hypothetical protein